MLENLNDYLSFFGIIFMVLLIVGVAIYFWNLKVIEKNIRKEVKYYDYERKR